MRNQFMQMTTRVLLIVFVVTTTLSGTPDLDALPDAVVSRIDALGKYDVSDRINPFYLRGDFDADGRVDYAVLIEEHGTRKRGIVILLSSQPKLQILGAGNPVQAGATKWDDLNFDSWRAYDRSPIDAGLGFDPPPGKGDLIYVQKKESAGGFYRWSGTHFTWVQQGD